MHPQMTNMQASAHDASSHICAYLRIRGCACVRQRIRRVCRCIGSLSCLRSTQARMSLGTTVPYAGRAHMQHEVHEAFVAFIGLDWADATHDVCLPAAGSEHREHCSLA